MFQSLICCSCRSRRRTIPAPTTLTTSKDATNNNNNKDNNDQFHNDNTDTSLEPTSSTDESMNDVQSQSPTATSAEELEEQDILLTRYAKELQNLKEDSKFFTEHNRSHHPIPKFVFGELDVGNILGVGGFCTVREIRGITLLDGDDDADTDTKSIKDTINNTNNSNSTGGLDIQFADASTRTYMSQNTLRDSHSRYAIKQLRTDLIPPPSHSPPPTTQTPPPQANPRRPPTHSGNVPNNRAVTIENPSLLCLSPPPTRNPPQVGCNASHAATPLILTIFG